MQQIELLNLLGGKTVVEQGGQIETGCRFRTGDILKDITRKRPFSFYFVVGFSEDQRGEKYFWYTNSIFTISNGNGPEVRIRPFFATHTGWTGHNPWNSSMPFIKVIRKSKENYLNEEEILKILKEKKMR